MPRLQIRQKLSADADVSLDRLAEGADTASYTVEVEGEVESELEDVFQMHMQGPQRFKMQHDSMAANASYTIFVLNPAKDRLRPPGLSDGKDFVYRYSCAPPCLSGISPSLHRSGT